VSAGAGKAKKINGEAVRVAEEVRLLECLSSDAVVVALTRDGKGLSSKDLASFLEEKAVRSAPQIVFVIGGAFGLGDRILKKASLRLSLSTMTLPHEVARLVLAEQLYRAGSILRNEPYHKGP
jgi:23S rRNA (pseudouridine1915-N3)-methyltransferase